MDTYSFLKSVLPKSGLKILAELVEVKDLPKPAWRYTAFPSIEAMAEAVAQIDAAGRTIYFACNGYGDWYEEEVKGKMKKRIRTQRNVVACRSLYDDIDIGKPGCYDTKKEAAAHVNAFVTELGLPAPTIVNSGGGLHLYWTLTDDVSPEDWTVLAGLKRAAVRKFGLKTDPAVDMDTARVLRPVGATWRKNGERDVKVVFQGAPTAYADLVTAFKAYAGDLDIAALPARRESRFEITNDLAAVEYPPSSLARVAEHCHQIQMFRSTGGESEPVWYACLGVGKHCTDGEALVHDWSAKYAGYIKGETQDKLDQWPHGPTTCAKFREVNPTGCEGCQHNVTSPIQLGYSAEGKAPVVEPQPEVVVEAPIVESFDALKIWPEGFAARNGGISAAVEDPETHLIVWSHFVHPVFYPCDWVLNEDETYSLIIRHEVRPGVWRDAELPTKNIADPRGLRMALAARGIIVSNDKLAFKYMSAYLEQLRANRKEMETYKQFGWHNGFTEFLVGNTVISAEGTREVRVGKRINDPELLQAFNPKGDVSTWVEGVDFLYNRESGEPYQYAIAAGFGAALVPLFNRSEWNGIPLALTSDEGGYGKSTVCLIATNIYADSSKIMVADCTPKAVTGRASSMNNLPVLFDEVTNTLKEADPLADVLYALSNGRARIGMTTNGTERDPAPPWKLMSFLTGNKNLTYQLTGAKHNPEAVQLRLFEISLDDYPKLINKDSGDYDLHNELAQTLLNKTACEVGLVYLRWVMQNRERVTAALEDHFVKLSEKVREAGGDPSKERFFIYHASCSLLGATIAKNLGLIRFDVKALRAWTIGHIARMRENTREYGYNVQETFSRFLSELHGHVLVTKLYNSLDGRVGKTELPMVPLRGAVKARLVIGDEKELGRLIVSVQAIDDWCREKFINPLKFRRDLAAAKMVLWTSAREDNRKYLAKGVPTIADSRMRTLQFNLSAAQSYVDAHLSDGEDNVVEMSSTGRA